ncbi:FtsX-like permease family protein [Gilvimarinus sp. SDUM040013]|uniref:FtsX-like permease family protein n=1 Tax=Gilvimarinus gilvus TaxID=3058038 RepID=A0ABU4RX83_9GAMM|nr:FtsX-like permease family protein [Gilvimarinus sp. SDUM040013]MDO3386641.1 FtsX-like permease family protein [Gilvimarinus sp. SDUM040013]MDX6849472.1 FtsX-like permease family protein [Gilvimarinus sp. SDUM040013]
MLDVMPILKSLWRSKIGPFLIICQMALTVAIVSNSVFFLSGKLETIARPTGLADTEVAMAKVKQRPGATFSESVLAEDIASLQSVAGVAQAAAIGQGIPFSQSGGTSGFSILPDSDPDRVNRPAAFLQVDHRVIDTLGVSLRQGRNFRAEEIKYYAPNQEPQSANAIITASLASDIYGQQDPINQTLYLAGVWPLTVIGVVEDFIGYFPHSDYSYSNVLVGALELSASMNYILRSDNLTPASVLPEVRRALQGADPRRIVRDDKTMASMKSHVYQDDYAMVILLLVVNAGLIFVNVLGVVGITTYWVNQRRRQIGVRRALGATRFAIQRYFLLENVVLVVLASVLGAAAAAAASYYFVVQYAMELLPGWYMLAAATMMLLVTIAAAWVPAHGATRVQPREAVSA